MYIPYDDDGGHFTQGVGHGSAIFTLRRPYNPLHWFELSFDTLIGGNITYNGEGVAICVGKLTDEVFSDEGQGKGLIVRLRSYPVDQTSRMVESEVIEVWYAGEITHVVWIGRSLRTSSWVKTRVRMGPNGLSVWHNDVKWVDEYIVRGWAPKPDWRVGIGAKAGPYPELHLSLIHI